MDDILRWVENSWGVDRNTSATILITILVFVTGILINEFISWVRFQLKLHTTRSVLKNQIRTISRDALIQSKAFEEFVQFLTVSDNRPLMLAENTITHLDTIDKIDFRDLYNSVFRRFNGFPRFDRRKKIKALNTLLKYTSSLRGCEERYPTDLEKLIEKFHGYQKDWDQHVETLRQMFDTLILHTQGQNLPIPAANYIMQLDAIWHNWQQQPNRQFFDIVYNSLLVPLQQLNSQYPTNTVAHAMNNPILGAMHAFDNMSGLLEIYRNAFRSYQMVYRKASKLLALVERKI